MHLKSIFPVCVQPVCAGEPVGHHGPGHRPLLPGDTAALARPGRGATLTACLAGLPCTEGAQRRASPLAQRLRPCPLWAACVTAKANLKENNQ